jgi:hypothetical protein
MLGKENGVGLPMEFFAACEHNALQVDYSS